MRDNDPPDHYLFRCAPRRIGGTKGGLNSKLHAVCDGMGRPIMMLLSEGQMSDHKGAVLLLSALPRAKELLADKPVLSLTKGLALQTTDRLD